MSFDVYPLAITVGDISALQRVCQDVLGYSPTRALDKTYLKPDDPAAFLACLDLENDPLGVLRDSKFRSGVLCHFYASMIATVPTDVIPAIANLGRLNLLSKAGKRESVLILSGSMDAWHDTILAGCSKDVDTDVRGVTTGALHCFERVGFREIFNKYSHKQMPDGTVTLWHK